MTIDCPHMEIGRQECPGCQPIDDAYGCEGGEILGRAYLDSEGDAGVIGGINNFVGVEDVRTTCGCVLDDAEIEKVSDALAESYYDCDPSDDPQFPY